MKRIIDFFTATIATIFVFVLVPLIGACVEFKVAPVSESEYVSERIEIEIPECTALFYENTHGGFHGDGATGSVLVFTEENAEILTEKIITNGHWNPLPMTEFIEAMFYGRTYGGCGFSTLLSDYLQEVNKGYWFFFNKQTKEYTIDYETYRVAFSSNYYISVYDSEKLRLYFYGLDT